MIYITKTIKFSSAHWLSSPHLSPEENKKTYGKDYNPDRHGHNYILEVTVKGEPDPRTGMVMNLVDLKKIMVEEIFNKVDHRDLTTDVEFLKDVIPTSENLSVKFWELIEKRLPSNVVLDSVRLFETDSGWVTFRGVA